MKKGTIETIFDYSPTDSELIRLCGKVTNKEEYLTKTLPSRYITGFSDEEQLEYQALSDLSYLYSMEMRNDREKSLKYTDIMRDKFSDIWDTYFNE